MINSKIVNEVKIWETSLVIPFYSEYFKSDTTQQISLSGNCLYDNENYKVDDFAKTLIVNFAPDDLIAYCKYILDNDPQKSDSLPGKWPDVCTEQPFPRYYVILVVFLILNLHAYGIDLTTIRSILWNNICSAKQDYWPEFLFAYIICVYDNQKDLFTDTIKLLYHNDVYTNNLAYSIFYGSSDFPEVPQYFKNSSIHQIDTHNLTKQSRKILSKIKNEFGYSIISKLRMRINDFF